MNCVLVSQRVDEFPERNEIRDSLDQNVTKWLSACGYAAMPVPNTYSDAMLSKFLSKLNVDGIVLSGGGIVGQPNERAKTEKSLLNFSQQENVPVVGVCRGMQVLLNELGVVGQEVRGHVRTNHQLKINPNVQGEFPTQVNSFHEIGFHEVEMPEIEILARCSVDNTIEAFKHKSLPWEGWMWHPEREQSFNKLLIDRIRFLFS